MRLGFPIAVGRYVQLRFTAFFNHCRGNIQFSDRHSSIRANTLRVRYGDTEDDPESEWSILTLSNNAKQRVRVVHGLIARLTMKLCLKEKSVGFGAGNMEDLQPIDVSAFTENIKTIRSVFVKVCWRSAVPSLGYQWR